MKLDTMFMILSRRLTAIRPKTAGLQYDTAPPDLFPPPSISAHPTMKDTDTQATQPDMDAEAGNNTDATHASNDNTDKNKPKVKQEAYYAVFYDDQFHIGRVLAHDDEKAEMKFLREIYPGTFNWPSSPNIEDVLLNFIFYGPVEIEGHGPFTISDLNEIKQAYRKIKKIKSQDWHITGFYTK